MRISKAQLELAKKRGAKVVGDKAKPAAPAPAPVVEAKSAPAPSDKAVDALLMASNATLLAVEQVKTLADSISKNMQAPPVVAPAPPQAPPSYKFSVKRDRNNRMTEIIAVPIESK